MVFVQVFVFVALLCLLPENAGAYVASNAGACRRLPQQLNSIETKAKLTWASFKSDGLFKIVKIERMLVSMSSAGSIANLVEPALDFELVAQQPLAPSALLLEC